MRTASCPVIASATSSTSRGLTAARSALSSHHLGVDLQPPGGVDDDGAAARLLGLAQGVPHHVRNPLPTSLVPRPREDRHPDLLTELSQLLGGRRPVRIRRNQSRRLLLDLEPARQFGRRRRLARALETDQQNHRRPH